MPPTSAEPVPPRIPPADVVGPAAPVLDLAVAARARRRALPPPAVVCAGDLRPAAGRDEPARSPESPGPAVPLRQSRRERSAWPSARRFRVAVLTGVLLGLCGNLLVEHIAVEPAPRDAIEVPAPTMPTRAIA